MKQKQWAEGLFILVMLGLLAGVLITTILRPKEQFSFYENRNLAEMPQATWETVGDGSYFQDLETYGCDYAAFRTTLMKGAAWVDLNLFHRPVVNDVVVTDSQVLLAYNDYETVDREKIQAEAEAMADQLSQLNDLVEGYGGTFLYVTVPSQNAYYADRYPSYLNSHSEFVAAELENFFPALEARGVPYLDMGQLWEVEENPTTYMSTVDHHYTWAGCVSTYDQVMENLNARGVTLRTLTAADLTVHTLPNPYQGSLSRKLCGQWTSSERLAYATINAPIDFVRYNWRNPTPGASTVVTLPETDWEAITYTVYMGGDIDETIIETNRPDLPTALVFGDSFTNPLEGLLYASFDELRSLDLRMYTEMSLADYVMAYQPEVVICVRDYTVMLEATGNGCLFGAE